MITVGALSGDDSMGLLSLVVTEHSGTGAEALPAAIGEGREVPN